MLGGVREHYSIGKQIGKGTYGTVHRCCHRETKKLYAVKIIRSKDIEDIFSQLRELLLLRFIRHPQIISIKDYYVQYSTNEIAGFDIPKYYWVMNYYPYTLRDIAKERANNRNYKTKVLSIFLQLVSAVNYLHNNGINHYDIRLENVLVSLNGRSIVLADFSLATYQLSKHPIDLSSSIRYWQPPEAQKGCLTCKADVWSLGILFLTMFYEDEIYGLRESWSDKLVYNTYFDSNSPHYLIPVLVREYQLQGMESILLAMLHPDMDKRCSISQVMNFFYLPPEFHPVVQYFNVFPMRKELLIEMLWNNATHRLSGPYSRLMCRAMISQIKYHESSSTKDMLEMLQDKNWQFNLEHLLHYLCHNYYLY
jgi:serine/threonine protein kinase